MGGVISSSQRDLLMLTFKFLSYTGGRLADRGLSAIKASMKVHTPGWILVHYANIMGTASVPVGSKDTDKVFLVQSKKNLNCMLTFSGTEAAIEYLTSLDHLSVSFCGFYPVHRGFTEEIYTITHSQEYQHGIKPKLSKCSSVTVVGHSLCGAIASVFAACINGRVKDNAAYQQMAWKKGNAELMSE